MLFLSKLSLLFPLPVHHQLALTHLRCFLLRSSAMVFLSCAAFYSSISMDQMIHKKKEEMWAIGYWDKHQLQVI